VTKATERKVVIPSLPEKGGLSVLHRAVQQLAEAHNHHDDTLNSALRGGMSSLNNNLVKYVDLTVQAPAEAPFVAMTLINSWANVAGYDTTGVLMMPGGLVIARGAVNTGAPGDAAFNLPTGFSPLVSIAYAAGMNGAGYVRVQSGTLTPNGAASAYALSNSWLAAPAASPTPFSQNGAPGWPLRVQHGFSQCTGLDVVACQELSRNTKGSAPLPTPAWQDVGNGQLRLDGLWGLQWGKKYQVRLRMTAET
jgi:hypothetical protein